MSAYLCYYMYLFKKKMYLYVYSVFALSFFVRFLIVCIYVTCVYAFQHRDQQNQLSGASKQQGPVPGNVPGTVPGPVQGQVPGLGPAEGQQEHPVEEVQEQGHDGGSSNLNTSPVRITSEAMCEVGSASSNNLAAFSMEVGPVPTAQSLTSLPMNASMSGSRSVQNLAMLLGMSMDGNASSHNIQALTGGTGGGGGGSVGSPGSFAGTPGPGNPFARGSFGSISDLQSWASAVMESQHHAALVVRASSSGLSATDGADVNAAQGTPPLPSEMFSNNMVTRTGHTERSGISSGLSHVEEGEGGGAGNFLKRVLSESPNVFRGSRTTSAEDFLSLLQESDIFQGTVGSLQASGLTLGLGAAGGGSGDATGRAKETQLLEGDGAGVPGEESFAGEAIGVHSSGNGLGSGGREGHAGDGEGDREGDGDNEEVHNSLPGLPV
ncbi:unnamed protein product, partial [Choristocarpus tenellus]